MGGIGRAVAGVGGLVYALDVAHTYGVLWERSQDEERYVRSWDRDDRLGNPERWYEALTGLSLVKSEEFQRELASKEAARKIDDGQMLRAFADSLYIHRESVQFLLGGRATLLQVAHPYVASGIAAHSNLTKSALGLRERFFRTKNYMFALAFGQSAEARRAAASVRRLHQKVYGTLPEAVGAFPAGHSYDANHPHALLWVHLSLVDSSMLAHELIIGRLSKDQKDAFVRAGNSIAGFVGIPAHLLPADHAAFKSDFHNIVCSGVIAVGEDARRIDNFLWRSPNFAVRSVLVLTRWSSMTMMPDKLARVYIGRSVRTAERMLVALYLGLVRFIYRLVPKNFRWISEYVELCRREGVPMSFLDEKLAAASAAFASFAIARMFPPRPIVSLI